MRKTTQPPSRSEILSELLHGGGARYGRHTRAVIAVEVLQYLVIYITACLVDDSLLLGYR